MNEIQIKLYADFFDDLDDPVASLSEEFLIDRLASESPYQVWAAARLLQVYGSLRSVDHLKPLLTEDLKKKKGDIQAAAAGSLFTILAKEKANPIELKAAEIFERTHQDPKFKQKWMTSIYLSKIGTKDHFDILFKRMKQISARKRLVVTTLSDDGETTEVIEFIEFCARTQSPITPLLTLMSKRNEWFYDFEKAKAEELLKTQDT